MRFTALIALSLLCVNAIADGREELRSYLEVQQANWSSIEQFDLLCRTDRLGEPGVEPGFTETVYERFIFDFNRDRYVYVQTGNRKSLADGEPSQVVETGFIISDGHYRSFKPAYRHLEPQRVTTKEKVFDDHRVPDLRMLMFMKTGRGSSRTWTEKKVNAFRIYPQKATSVKFLGETDGRVGFEAYFANNSGYRWHFDIAKLAPVDAEWRVKQPGSEQTLIVGKEFYEWENRNAVLIPIKVEGTFRDRQFRTSPEDILNLPPSERTADKIRELYVDTSVHRDVRFNWLSVNKPLNDEQFEFKLIDSPERFVALSDPSAVGAPELANEFVERDK